MSSTAVKYCPKCKSMTPIQSSSCSLCSHIFRTKFDANGNVSPASPPTYIGPVSTHRTVTARPRAKVKPLHFAAAVAGLGAFAGVTGFLILQHNAKQLTAAPFPPTLSGEVYLAVGFGGQGTVPVSTHDVEDSWRFFVSYGTSINGRLIGNGDSLTQQELLTSGRVFEVRQGTKAKVISLRDNSALVRILDGIDEGREGYVNKYWLYRLKEGGGISQIIPDPPTYSQPLQKPDGTMYKMAGVDFPADKDHPAGMTYDDNGRPLPQVKVNSVQSGF